MGMVNVNNNVNNGQHMKQSVNTALTTHTHQPQLQYQSFIQHPTHYNNNTNIHNNNTNIHNNNTNIHIINNTNNNNNMLSVQPVVRSSS